MKLIDLNANKGFIRFTISLSIILQIIGFIFVAQGEIIQKIGVFLIMGGGFLTGYMGRIYLRK